MNIKYATLIVPCIKRKEIHILRNYEANNRILRNCEAGGEKIRNFEAEIDGKLRNF